MRMYTTAIGGRLTDAKLDEVNGGEGNLSTTILDDADLEVVSGGVTLETTMYVLGIEGLYQASKAAGHQHR